jgi:hypothetical protein
VQLFLHLSQLNLQWLLYLLLLHVLIGQLVNLVLKITELICQHEQDCD